MQIFETRTMVLAVFMALTPACNDDPAPAEGQDSDGEDSEGEQCDPEGADAQMGMLLNAPVAADVEVIVKTPQHPGPAGPRDLP
ncbi:MAG: hypothetical protein AAGF11_33590 [Myxococcota bacterium]